MAERPENSVFFPPCSDGPFAHDNGTAEYDPPMKRLIFAVVALFVLGAAAEPVDVAPVLEAQRFYVEDGSDVDAGAVENAVIEARFEGGDLSIAVLAIEPTGGPGVFADNTLDEMGGEGTVFVLSPASAAWASLGDIYTKSQLDKATDAALDGASDTEAVELFVATLIDAPVGAAQPAGAGGFPWGWFLFLVVIAGGALFLWRASKSSKRNAAAAVAAAKVEVKKRLDDVANDIIDLEDEVATSEIPEVPVLYQSATEAYSQALETYERGESPAQLLATAEELDLAIWQLDCAEALLDGLPLPPKPEKPKPQPQPTAPPRPSMQSSPGGSPLDTPPRVPQSRYRRPNRRTSSDTAAMLTGLLMGMLSSSQRGSGRSSGGMFGSSGQSRSSGRRRMRGGGRRRR